MPVSAKAQFDDIELCYNLYGRNLTACDRSAEADLFSIGGELGLACAPLIFALNLPALLLCMGAIVKSGIDVILAFEAYVACLEAAEAELNFCLECS